MKQSLIAMVSVGLLASASVAGQSAGPRYGAPDPAKPAAQSAPAQGFVEDRSFVMEAAQSATADAVLGRLALEKAQNAAVRQYAQRIIDAAEKLRAELTPLLEAHSLSVGPEIDRRHGLTRDWLLKTPAAAFDRAFMTAMTAKGSNDVTFTQRAASIVRDPEVKAWAIRALPVVKAQHEAARDVTAKLK
jgi:putative membrane protein